MLLISSAQLALEKQLWREWWKSGDVKGSFSNCEAQEDVTLFYLVAADNPPVYLALWCDISLL